jgi:hypothetical protein
MFSLKLYMLPNLLSHIIGCDIKCPIEVLFLAMTHQQTTSSVMRHLRTAEKITRCHPIGSEGYRSDSDRVFRNVEFVCENITFACSLPTSTSTWPSDHHNEPGGYMSGELKSENINTKKAPTRKSHHPAKRSLNHPIEYNYI